MKTLYKSLLFGLAGLFMTSCGDLDINDNPNYPTVATPDMLIPSGITWTAAQVGGDLQLLGGMWSQHYAQGNSSTQYGYMSEYNIKNSDFARFWLAIYAGALPDLYYAREQAEASGEWGYWIPAQVMIAFDYHIAVDFYGTIPFTEAIKGDISAPKYDDGKTVNKGIIDLLDAAIAKESDANGKSSLDNKDFVFKGDIAKWVEFARTLKLKILMRDFDTNKVAISTLLQSGKFLSSDAKMNGFMDKENNSNPLYENDRRKLNTKNNIRANITMVTFLQKNSDPRISAFYDMPMEGDTYKGIVSGASTITQIVVPQSTISIAHLEATDPVYFMSVAESNFLQAEAYARLGEKSKAKSFYDAGVTDAFARWSMADKAAGFLTGAYAFDDSSIDSMIKSIITQKWIAAIRCQAWDSFFDINRTGYPELGSEYPVSSEDWETPNSKYVVGTLTPPVTSYLKVGEFPRRLLIAKNSSDNNQNAPAVIPLAEKMWWHK